jgi:hypothetical protein
MHLNKAKANKIADYLLSRLYQHTFICTYGTSPHASASTAWLALLASAEGGSLSTGVEPAEWKFFRLDIQIHEQYYTLHKYQKTTQ